MNRAPLTEGNVEHTEWLDLLDDEGIEALVVEGKSDLDSISPDSLPHLAAVDLAFVRGPDIKACIEKCSEMNLPVIGLIPVSQIGNHDVNLEFHDFVSSPPNPDEIITRVKQVLWRTRSQQDDDTIRVGDLTINPSTYEVTLKGQRVNLRFKEYELLRLLVTNPGRVYTREALLSHIWGYDYFGGTRTVDVHIRRLRSKIEDSDHPFIETIWNVGYRFRAPGA